MSEMPKDDRDVSVSAALHCLQSKREADCSVCMASSLPWRNTTVGSVQKHPTGPAQDTHQLSTSKASETVTEVTSEDGRVCLSSKAELKRPDFHHRDRVNPLIKALPSLICRSRKRTLLEPECMMFRVISWTVVMQHHPS